MASRSARRRSRGPPPSASRRLSRNEGKRRSQAHTAAPQSGAKSIRRRKSDTPSSSRRRTALWGVAPSFCHANVSLLSLFRPAAGFTALAALTVSARAADCALGPRPATPFTSIRAYRPVLKSCEAPDGHRAFAIREMTIGGEGVALLADAEALTTRLERAACLTCQDVSGSELASTRMGRAVAASAEAR